MPVPAAGSADVVAGDPHPLELRGSGEHALEQLAVALLQVVLLAQGSAGVLDASRERVAHRLQLAEVERPTAGGEGGDAGVDLDPRERLGGQRDQAVLQPADLAPQLGARKALVAADLRRGAALSGQKLRHAFSECSRRQADSSVVSTIHNASSTAICGTEPTWIAATAIRRVSFSTP